MFDIESQIFVSVKDKDFSSQGGAVWTGRGCMDGFCILLLKIAAAKATANCAT